MRDELRSDVMAHDGIKRTVATRERDMAAAVVQHPTGMAHPTRFLRYVYEYMINGGRMNYAI